MEGPERDQPDHFCLNGLFTFVVNRIVYQSCRVLWKWKGLSGPSLFNFV